jgi:hypothetical protein
MFLKPDPYRVWWSIFYSKLINCILLRSLCSTFVLWMVGEHAVVGKETLKFGSIFGSLPDFPSLRPLVNWERSQVALFFTMCGEPWFGECIICSNVWLTCLPADCVIVTMSQWLYKSYSACNCWSSIIIIILSKKNFLSPWKIAQFAFSK